MLETMKEILLVIGRVVTILPLLLLITLYMGKRAIGELPVFDFLVIITLASVVGADIADPNIHHFPTVIAIIAIGILQRVVAKWKISNRKVNRFVSFEPTVVIQNGQLLNDNLKKIRYSIENILQMLREKDIFDINEVETAIIEANGSISVLKKPEYNYVTVKDMQIHSAPTGLSFPVILEGTIYTDVLQEFNLNEIWLIKQLSHQGVYDMKDVFFASIDRNYNLHVSLKDPNVVVPKIKH
jgi:uncharacterized membrane protein YcaP (DUF421 family)